MRFAVAADHHGVDLLARLIRWLLAHGHAADDRGVHGPDVVDYPRLCAEVGRQVLGGTADFGIVLGGSGQGEQIACNKIRGIRAALCHCLFTTEIARAHNNANVLVMGAKVVSPDLAEEILGRWCSTEFKGGRHQHRLDLIAALERGESLA